MLVQCWARLDHGPTLNQHWVYILCSMGNMLQSANCLNKILNLEHFEVSYLMWTIPSKHRTFTQCCFNVRLQAHWKKCNIYNDLRPMTQVFKWSGSTQLRYLWWFMMISLLVYIEFRNSSVLSGLILDVAFQGSPQLSDIVGSRGEI